MRNKPIELMRTAPADVLQECHKNANSSVAVTFDIFERVHRPRWTANPRHRTTIASCRSMHDATHPLREVRRSRRERRCRAPLND